jgi:transposase
MRTTKQDFAELFQSMVAARVVMEVGTHSAWVRDVVAACGHEVLVANPRQMDGPKRRQRKNDRIDAHKLARLGRVDPQSLFAVQHRSVMYVKICWRCGHGMLWWRCGEMRSTPRGDW